MKLGIMSCLCINNKTNSFYLRLKIFNFVFVLNISKAMLSKANGQDKPFIWVAFEGKVYDVTESRLWQNGQHYEHWAGQDLTNELKDAPHTHKVFERFKMIGTLT